MVTLERDEDLLLVAVAMITLYLNEMQDMDMSMFQSFAAMTYREHVKKIRGFYEQNVHTMRPKEHRRFFRMYDDTMAAVINYISSCESLYNNCNSIIPLEKKIAMTCAYLGSKNTTMTLAYMFGISEERFLFHTNCVLEALFEKAPQIISFPDKCDLHSFSQRFDEIGRFMPHCIGALDTMHLELELNDQNHRRNCFINYKQFFSVHLQACCTYDLRFIHVFAGWPGRAGDGKVFRNSALFRCLKQFLHLDNTPLLDSYHIVADTAYPCMKHLITPYKKVRRGDLTPEQSLFNTHVSSKRQNIERAFGMLIKRFPRLQLLNQKTLRKKIKVIMAACVLHNICIMENDNIQFYLNTSKRRRNRVREMMATSPPEPDQIQTDAGKMKRELLTALVNANV